MAYFIRLMILCWLLGLSGSVVAVVETYPFDSPQMRQHYHDLMLELRCPKCQNQTLADSNAPIAADLRAKVYQLLREHKTKAEIRAYLVARYGDFVLYRPPVNWHTITLWLLPGIALMIGIAVVIVLVRKNRQVEGRTSLDPSQQQRVADIITATESDQ